MTLLTVGAKGLYIGATTEKEHARLTKDPLHTKSIVDYNKFEYSRAMRRADCKEPLKVYSHINPFMGGPNMIKNTNGAGDAASPLFYMILVPIFITQNSTKACGKFFNLLINSQISKYANRVSFEVLSQNSPRLSKGLPEKEDSLEEAYWSK